MRILEPFALIVEMLFQVTFDLQYFIFFYFILIILFSMIISVLGIGNYRVQKKLEGELQLTGGYDKTYEDLGLRGDLVNAEYYHIGLVFAHIMDMIKVSLGDFGVIDKSMSTEES